MQVRVVFSKHNWCVGLLEASNQVDHHEINTKHALQLRRYCHKHLFSDYNYIKVFLPSKYHLIMKV